MSPLVFGDTLRLPMFGLSRHDRFLPKQNSTDWKLESKSQRKNEFDRSIVNYNLIIIINFPFIKTKEWR